MKKKPISLKSLNIYACVLHSLCFIALLILYLVFKKTKPKANIKLFRYEITGPITETVPPIYPDTLSYCSTGAATSPNPGQCVVAPNFQQPKKVSMINIIVSCLVFFGITAIAHGLYAWDGFNNFYSNAIYDGWNPYRWFEYALSASLMSVILGAVQGSVDITTILFMGGVTAAMQFNGYSTESVMRKTIVRDIGYVQKDVIFGSSFSAWLLFAFLWFCNLYSFTVLINDVKNKYDGVIDPETNKQIKVPNFVYFIVAIQFFNYASFGFIQLYQIIKNWNVKDYTRLLNFENIEKYYLILSFAAKLGLAGGVSYGLILRTKNCDT